MWGDFHVEHSTEHPPCSRRSAGCACFLLGVDRVLKTSLFPLVGYDPKTVESFKLGSMSNCNGILIVTLAPFPHYTYLKDHPESSPCSREGFLDTLSRMLPHLTSLPQ